MDTLRMGKLGLNFETGRYTVELDQFKLENCASHICGENGKLYECRWELKDKNAARLEYRCENEAGKWKLELALAKAYGGTPCVEIELSGRVDKPLPYLKLIPLALEKLSFSHVLSQGPRMGGCKAIKAPAAKKEQVEGHHQLMISRPGSHLQLSFPLRQEQAARFALELEGSELALTAEADIAHYGGLELKAPRLRLASSADGFAMMEAWADENSEGAKDLKPIAAPGWNSWDYYRWTITEDEVLENAEFIARDPVLSKHVKKIIVDDGWQYCYGEWEANPLFPNGMESLAKKLTKMGFEPGLWFAPTIVEPHARIAQVEYDMLAKGEAGEPCLAFECMRRSGFVLDPTQEKVKKHLFQLFSRYASMGYKYFKLDFMGATLKARRFADPLVPRSEIARLIVEPIHEAVKGKAKILGCNYHFDGGGKFVDSVRIGSDIHARWDRLKENTVSVGARFWSNGRLWLNDPDFALCRGLDTSDDPDLKRLKPCLVFITPEAKELEPGWLMALVDMKRPQLEILLGVTLMAAGAVNLSDKMTRLNESGLDLARRTVSAERGEAARPLDLFESERPSYWLQKLSKGHRVLMVNWGDEPASREVDLKALGIEAKSARNFWNDEAVSIENGVLKAKLQPATCLMAEIAG